MSDEETASLMLALRDANERLVVAMVRAQTMAEAAEAAGAKMSHMATHDFLTGLPNRALLTDRLAQAILHTQRSGKRVALMYLDLDHFKHINDSLGHDVGDALLQAVATRLRDNVRQSDTVSRQGGDEFVVLLAEVDATRDAVQAAQNLMAALTEPYVMGDHRLRLTLSMGITMHTDDRPSVETMMRNADTAMYHAKRHGRNQFAFFAPEMNVRVRARMSVETALRDAINDDGLVLHYQPKVNIGSGAIIGAEALVRLRSNGHPLMYPTSFIQVAEDCGLIQPLGHWVMEQACQQIAQWLRAGLPVGQIAVNVSAIEFHGKDFLPGIRSILLASGLDPGYLEVEVTESGLLQDNAPNVSVLHGLKDLGVRIALDDFGTGYSSLSYLRHFPIDTIKIDQSFIRDIENTSGGPMLVDAIIAMGRSLDLRVVAEGIETRGERDYLQSSGCTEGQGYYFGRPVKAAAFEAMLQAPALIRTG